MDHDHSHGGSQKRVSPKFLCGAEAYEYGQEYKGCIGKRINGSGQSLPLGKQGNDRLAVDQR